MVVERLRRILRRERPIVRELEKNGVSLHTEKVRFLLNTLDYLVTNHVRDPKQREAYLSQIYSWKHRLEEIENAAHPNPVKRFGEKRNEINQHLAALAAYTPNIEAYLAAFIELLGEHADSKLSSEVFKQYADYYRELGEQTGWAVAESNRRIEEARSRAWSESIEEMLRRYIFEGEGKDHIEKVVSALESIVRKIQED